MVVSSPHCPAAPAVEASPSVQAQLAVHRLAAIADRLRAVGQRGEADAALLQAWAAYDS